LLKAAVEGLELSGAACQRGGVYTFLVDADLRVCVSEVPEDLQFFVEARESDAFTGVPEVRE